MKNVQIIVTVDKHQCVKY